MTTKAKRISRVTSLGPVRRKPATIPMPAANSNAKLVAHMSHTVELTGDVTEKDGKMMIAASDLKMAKK
jgi:hypothetical protein